MKKDKNIHILFASRLVFEKGADILIEAIDASLHRFIGEIEVIWHITSTGYYIDRVLELVKKYPKNVIYHGVVDQTALADLYREADILFMPSRFLETFGLTALEALTCGTPVVGFRKGGLIPFIPDTLALDHRNPIVSFMNIIEKGISEGFPEAIDVSMYRSEVWKKNVESILHEKKNIFLVHDYSDLIGGAEYYLRYLQSYLESIGKDVGFYGYSGKTTNWKRRWMFIFSLFAFWRGVSLSNELRAHNPDIIWMHSILRYVGPWGIFAISRYVHHHPRCEIFLSHHDVGLIAPFPQSITSEGEIPSDDSFRQFLPKNVSFFRKIMASGKWIYVTCIKLLLPKKITHIIFSSFLSVHIRSHFQRDDIIVLPHTVAQNFEEL